MHTLSPTEYLSCAVFLLQDLGTQHVSPLLDPTQARIIPPKVAHGMAGRVNGSHKRHRVTKSVRRNTRQTRSSIVVVRPLDGAGGSAMG